MNCTLTKVNTHSSSRQTSETTLSTLSGETYNTTLSSNTLGSGDTSGTLHRVTQRPVSKRAVQN